MYVPTPDDVVYPRSHPIVVPLFAYVKVCERIPNVLVNPRDGVVAANVILGTAMVKIMDKINAILRIFRVIFLLLREIMHLIAA